MSWEWEEGCTRMDLISFDEHVCLCKTARQTQQPASGERDTCCLVRVCCSCVEMCSSLSLSSLCPITFKYSRSIWMICTEVERYVDINGGYNQAGSSILGQGRGWTGGFCQQLIFVLSFFNAKSSLLENLNKKDNFIDWCLYMQWFSWHFRAKGLTGKDTHFLISSLGKKPVSLV